MSDNDEEAILALRDAVARGTQEDSLADAILAAAFQLGRIAGALEAIATSVAVLAPRADAR